MSSTINSANFSDGTSGQVLTSNGPSTNPTFQSISAAGAITTITGNSGGAESPSAGNFNLLTAHATVKFVGSAATETVDFGATSNLCLGTSLPSLSGGTSNTSVGSGFAGNAISSGTLNVLVGYATGGTISSGGSNVCIGSSAGSSYTTESNNICIGTGVNGTVGDSAVTRIGPSGTQTKCFIAGIDGVNVGSVAKVVTEASDQLGTATITAGTNISVTAGANTITIAALGGGAVAWSVISANQTAAVNNGYFCNKAGTLALALPTTSAVGDVIEVANENTATGIQFTQAAGQQILLPNNTSTTSGATGTLTSSAIGDTMKLVCKTANTVWRCVSLTGNWTPA